jgi:hypothetical protein
MGVAARLRELEPVAAAQRPDVHEDPDGAHLKLLLAWRRQRAAALEAEVARLGAAVASAAGREEAADADTPQQQAPQRPANHSSSAVQGARAADEARGEAAADRSNAKAQAAPREEEL